MFDVRCFRLFFLALALVLSGCTPAGPRAMLKGKKYLDRGEVVAAVTQFKRATMLLATNANAWNYLGVAEQRAGQPDEAAAAYQTALKLDRDLVEAHFNLGCLWLEQNRPDAAKSEFTAYTLRRPNAAAGWLKLGSAQLRSGETSQAERSFSAVYHMDMNNPEALNGLGFARVQRGKIRDAAQFFAAALQSRPDYAPALLNLAIVNQQYLRNNKAALENYRSYLALNPHPANYDEVKTLAAGLEQTDVATSVMTPAVVVKPAPAPAESKPKPSSATTQHFASASRSGTCGRTRGAHFAADHRPGNANACRRNRRTDGSAERASPAGAANRRHAQNQSSPGRRECAATGTDGE